jgi:CBS domain-containing protein
MALTFYLSRTLGKDVYDTHDNFIGKVMDILVEQNPIPIDEEETARPRVTALKLKISKITRYIDFSHVSITKFNGNYEITCKQVVDATEDVINSSLPLVQCILDKQIIDLNGRKLVRVNDVRLATIKAGTFSIAVDVGMEGLLRRIGLSKSLNSVLKLFRTALPSKFILWDDIEAIDFSNLNIRLSTTFSKLNHLHPSDLADIIENLGTHAKTEVFSSLDDETAADVLEELEPDAQVHILENISVEKAADVLEKMPAHEVADIMDELEPHKAEELLNEMEAESSHDVRELLEYADETVGSLMSTEFVSFNKGITAGQAIEELRRQKPEDDMLYSIMVTDDKERLVATISLRDLIVEAPETELHQIMDVKLITVFDDDKIDSLAEIISKYNMLAIPVIDTMSTIQGLVIIDDIITDLLDKRKTNKR